MKILYGVQGTGNGHISRARAIASELEKTNVEVDFLFSGRSQNGYFAMESFGDFSLRQGLSFVTHKGRVSYVRTALSNNPLRFVSEACSLDLKNYDLVLNDFEPVSAWAAKYQGVPCIGVSHQNAFRYDVPKVTFGLVDRAVIHQFAPCDFELGLHWYHYDQPILPPIISHSTEQSPEFGEAFLVYLPFELLGHITRFLTRFDGVQFVCYHPSIESEYQSENVLYKPLSLQGFKQDLAHCRGVICNGGFELPSEALALGKKLLLKPLKGQFEQQSNVATLEALGLATTMQHLDSSIMSQWVKEDLGEPVYYPNVAQDIVKWLLKANWSNQDELVDSLWSRVVFPSYVELSA
jgi:uncharacterized protein (TIGR00661 family)